MLQFGTGGWRAIIGDDFTKANIQLLMAAMAAKMKADNMADKGFLIGYDRRFLSEEAAKWAAEVMAGEGIFCRVVSRAVPTPLVMYAVQQYGLHLGVAVTASHNPAIYNGVKVFVECGQDAGKDVTDEIERYVARVDPGSIVTLPYEEGVAKGVIELIDPMNSYIDGILRLIDIDAIRERGLRIVLDPMYGVGKTALQTILITARCEVDVIHEQRDALFGGKSPAPSLNAMAEVERMVKEWGYDIGLATDGDADRLGVVDDKGNFLHPNKVLVLLYYYLLAYKGWRGSVVRSLATTHLLDRIAADFGEECHEVPVGFKYVSSKMVETDAAIGGESSGGLTVRGYIQGKDGIYAASLLVEMVAVTGKPLSQLYKEITEKYGTAEMEERDYTFSEKKKVGMEKVLLEDKLLPRFPWEVDHVTYVDGCKVYFKNGGWMCCRFSGTEPLLRLFCEMESLREAQVMAEVMEEFLELK